MSTGWRSLNLDNPSFYRARAQEARERAHTEADDALRKLLLRDAELWDRMADYEEKNPQTLN
jgi:hypothetical protein